MKKNFLFIFSLCFFLTTLFLLVNQKQENKPFVLGNNIQIQNKVIDKDSLENIINLYPNYRDGWLQMADYYYKNNNQKMAKECLLRALQIDPNNENIKSALNLTN
jgi:cytochrome c-type biogenesis protein CcmH/NrfG